MKSSPKSRAKTAYGLLSEIRTLILEEPKRYDQWDTLSIRDGDDPSMASSYYPACGTIGCVAGWTVALKYDEPRNMMGKVLPTAERILGLTSNQANHLFACTAAKGESRTRQHAQSGAAHIRRFQKQYRAQLLAKKV